ncbi:MAG: PQQ-binding-like beta-propeller repeat protein [Bacteroidales bacterium]|nr:PQQ-binding-like beta-propeller repeat protein [Bacteroidales bacterium]
MRKVILFIGLLLCFSAVYASDTFRFALFTDLHVQMDNQQPAEDLQNAVNDVNALQNIDFVIVSGDVTESGDLASLQKAKSLLDGLHIPYYITVGNHELKWSESGATDFLRVFGADKFTFTHKGFKFIGFATGPIIKMGDGHIAPQDIDWVNAELAGSETNIPVIAVTHYPLQTGDVDNWYDMTDVLRKYNVQIVLGGHYHRNSLLNYDQIPGIINRSTLRAKDSTGGYSLYTISDSIHVFEKKIAQPERHWLSVPVEQKEYDQPDLSLRPSYQVNESYKNVREIWRLDSRVAIYTTPAVQDNSVFYGDDLGFFHCVQLNSGKPAWKFKTGSRIISSPAVSKNKVVFGSTDGNIYCLETKTGKQIWKFSTTKAVMGCPLIQNDTVYIGGSDGCFRAFDLSTGKALWTFNQLKNYVETRAVVANGKVMFGAWDTNFYALNVKNGTLSWKWNNGQTRMHFSPAAVVPVVADGKVFITAPDRYWTALDVETGKVVWRTNQHEVRETVGLSEDGKTVFSRCMNDSVVALDAFADFPEIIWKTDAAFGYDHNASMPIERDGIIVFGTKNGLLLGVNAKDGKVLWRHKIGNSIINTITPLYKKECILTTTEGMVCRIKY